MRALPLRQGTACSKCGGSLEDLEGFYERHPDKQDNILQSGNVSQNAHKNY